MSGVSRGESPLTEASGNETAIRGLIDTLVAGWNAADAGKLASVFTADADFTISGRRTRGRELIARGHDEILRTIYRGTKNSAEVESIRFLRPDVAVVDATFMLRNQDGSLPFGIAHTSAGIIATEEGGVWSIAVLRNMVPLARPAAGPVESATQETARGS